MNSVLEDRLVRCRTLPTLPAVALHVIQLCDRPDFAMQDVSRAVNSDPVLAAKVLRLVNSSAFGIRREVTAIPQAFMFLGAKSVRNVALSFSLLKGGREVEKPGFDYEGYWKRSLVMGVASREIAKLVGYAKVEEAFLSGLIQDLGMLALAQIEPGYGEMLSAHTGPHEALLDKEKSLYGDTHAAVSRWLLKRWRLPEEIQTLAAHTHPTEAPTPRKAEERAAQIMALSGPAADVWLSADAALAARAFRGLADELMSLTPDLLETLFDSMATSLLEAAELFDISVGTKEQFDATLARVKLGLGPAEIDPFDPVAAAHKASEMVADPDDPLGEPVRQQLLRHFDEQRFEAALSVMCEDSARAHKVVSVVLVDVDGFIRVNNQLGRAAGDRLLRVLGHWLKMRLRGRDVAARLEGAAFALFLVETPLAGADLVAERLRRQIAESSFEVGLGRAVNITATFGCAALAADASNARALWAKASHALRVAKSERRVRLSSIPGAPR